MTFSLPIVLVTGAVCATVLLLDAALDLALAKWGKAWARRRRDIAEWWEAEGRRVATDALLPLAIASSMGLIVILAVPYAFAQVVHTTKITAHFPFTTRGVGAPDWQTGTAPTLDCLGSDYTGGATFTCSVSGGATWTKTGTVTAGQATPFYPNGFGGANATGMLFDGSTGYFSAGDVLDQTGDFSICTAFMQTDTASVHTIIAKDDTGQRQFVVITNVVAGVVDFYVFKAGGAASLISSTATATTSAWSVACFSYAFVTDGTSVLRMNMNGTDIAAVSNAVGPPIDVTAALEIGREASVPARKMQGDIQRLTLWSGTAFTQAKLKQMVLSYWGEIGSSGQQVAVTRATTETCQVNGVTGTIYTMPNGVACVNENGLQVFAASTNLVIRGDELDNADWVAASGTPTVTAGAAASLYDTDTSANIADRITDNDGTAAECIKAAARCGTATGTYSASAYIKNVSGGTSATLRIVTDGTGTASCETTGLTVGAWTRIVCANKAITGTPTSNDIWICPGRQSVVADESAMDVFGVQCEALANVTPVIRTAGAAVTRNLTVPSYTLAGSLVDPAGQVALTATLPSTWVDAGDAVAFATSGATFILDMTAATTVAIHDGTSAVTATTASSMVGRSTRLYASWGPGGRVIGEVGATPATGAYDEAIHGATAYFGLQVSASPINSYVKDVRFCRAPGGCE